MKILSENIKVNKNKQLPKKKLKNKERNLIKNIR